jgi:hypothetical protein
MGPVGVPETLVLKECTLHNNPEYRRIQNIRVLKNKINLGCLK